MAFARNCAKGGAPEQQWSHAALLTATSLAFPAVGIFDDL
jgi:hypothetical protein